MLYTYIKKYIIIYIKIYYIRKNVQMKMTKIVQKYQSIISNFYKHDNINIYIGSLKQWNSDLTQEQVLRQAGKGNILETNNAVFLYCRQKW